MSRSWKMWAPPLVSLVLLAGVAVEKALHAEAKLDVEPFHRRIVKAMNEAPYYVRQWVGRDAPIPVAAENLLMPTGYISRRFQHLATGRSVDLWIVHTRDARSLVGHYPPNCYGNSGWIQERTEPRTWKVGELSLDGIEYIFTRSVGTLSERIAIYNFMVLPNGRIRPDMESVDDFAADYRRKYLGAGQVQMIFLASMPREQRDEALTTMLEANMKVIQSMMTGAEE